MTRPTASFDVFDTLLTRTWGEPRDLFVELGGRLRTAALSPLDPMAFAQERKAAERRARARSASREIALGDIYHELAGRLLWSESQRSAAEAAEIALETESIRPVPGMRESVAAARRESGRVVFLSDMYLPSGVIRGWLADAGFFEDGDLMLVSGEMAAGKGDGALFLKARGRLDADFGAWTHVGDDPRSDCEAPRRLGISPRPARKARLGPRERALRGRERFAQPWRSLLAGAARGARLAYPGDPGDERRKTLWEIGATVAGPLFWSFTGWCLREAERRKIEQLFFLARGGQIFFRIAQAFEGDRPGRVRCRYLYTSRLAFAGAADADDPGYLRQLAAAPLAFHSARQALANLGLDENSDGGYPGLSRDEWDRNLAPAERSALADWLLAPERVSRAQDALAGRGRRARAYLRQAGLQAGARVGLVDTGWMGTIQRNIEFLLGVPGRPAALTGFYLGLSPVREFSCEGETLAYTNRFDRLSLRRETTHLILLELMARATHGPLLGFDDAGHPVAPRLGSPGTEDTLADVRLFQDAILAFAGRLRETPGIGDAPEDALAKAAIGAYRDFHLHPTAAEALAFGRIPHADQMLERHPAVLCPEMTAVEIVAAMFDFHRRPPGWWLPGQAVLGHAPLIKAYLALKRLKWWIRAAATGRPD